MTTKRSRLRRSLEALSSRAGPHTTPVKTIFHAQMKVLCEDSRRYVVVDNVVPGKVVEFG